MTCVCGSFATWSTGWAPRCHTDPCGISTSPIADADLVGRIAELERQLAALRVQLDAQVLAAIETVVGSRVAFSAGELFQHRRVAPTLQALFDEVLRIGSARRLGKRLQRMQGRPLGDLELRRIGIDHAGAIWVVVQADSH